LDIKNSYDLSNKEKISNALNKNKKKIGKANIEIVIVGFVFVIYTLLSLKLNLLNKVDIYMYFILSILSSFMCILLNHRISKYTFLSKLYESIDKIDQDINLKR